MDMDLIRVTEERIIMGAVSLGTESDTARQ